MFCQPTFYLGKAKVRPKKPYEKVTSIWITTFCRPWRDRVCDSPTFGMNDNGVQVEALLRGNNARGESWAFVSQSLLKE